MTTHARWTMDGEPIRHLSERYRDNRICLIVGIVGLLAILVMLLTMGGPE